MPDYSPKLPLALGKKKGYEMLTNLKDVVSQNLRMLVLTMPGERIMMPKFGAGVYRFFFEPMVPQTFTEVKIAIQEQVQTYMPYVAIRSIDFLTSDVDASLQDTTVRIIIRYRIPSFNTDDALDFEVNYTEK
jgi:phage baseplate assembly protein W